MIDVNEIKEAVEKLDNATYILHKEMLQKNEEILEHVFTECGYTVEEVMELHKAGRLKLESSSAYGFINMNYYYSCKIDGENVFIIRMSDRPVPGTYKIECVWNYEIYKKKGE